MSPNCPAAPDDAKPSIGGIRRVDRYNPGIGRLRRLAGRRLDAAGVHRQLGDTP